MGNLIYCRVCSGADPKRTKDGMIRCVRKHKFVDPEGACADHSNILPPLIPADIREALVKAYIDDLENKKGKVKK